MTLSGKTILVTRAAGQASKFTHLLHQAGAQVVELPALEIAPPSSWAALDDAIAQLPQYDWLILTSANAVNYFCDRVRAQGKDLSVLDALQIAVVGTKTERVLQKRGLQAHFTPSEFVADALAAEFPGTLQGCRLLFPRVETGGRDVLVQALTAQGAHITEVAAYQSRCPAAIAPAAHHALQQRQVDAVTFASSKTVAHFCQLLAQVAPTATWRDWLTGVCLASIGPQTSETCQAKLGRVDVEATEYTLEGLVAALTDWFARSR